MEPRKRVGVLKGGMSTERPVSLNSGAAVARALRARGHEVVEIDVGRDLPARLIAEGVEVAWLALHGRFGEDGCVQGLLEVMGIPYTGSGVRASAVAMDKVATKAAVRGLPGVVLAEDRVLRRGQAVPSDFPLPAIAKPAVGGSTIGMTRCEDAASLKAGIDAALELADEVLIEAWIEGDEITVAVLDGVALPVLRVLPEAGFYDYEAKYTSGRTRYEVPAQIPAATAEQAQQAAVAVYQALGCRGLCRADFMVRHADGVPVFLEINTLPGMTESSLSPMTAREVGLDFEDLVERVLATATCMSPEVAPPR